MKVFIRILLDVIMVISGVGFGAYWLWFMYGEFAGGRRAEELLDILHIPFTYEQAGFVGLICAACCCIAMELVRRFFR